MLTVAVIAADCAILRTPGGGVDASYMSMTALVFMSDLLVIGLVHLLTHRADWRPFLVRLEISGLVVAALFALAYHLRLSEPLVRATNLFLGGVSNHLFLLFRQSLSGVDSEDPLGRLRILAVLAWLPAMVLSALLSGVALAGALLWPRRR